MLSIRLPDAIEQRLAALTNPRDIGEALSGAALGHYWKYRVGDWRIGCDIQDARIVVRCCGSATGARCTGRARAPCRVGAEAIDYRA
jgi:hypothetical protein